VYTFVEIAISVVIGCVGAYAIVGLHETNMMARMVIAIRGLIFQLETEFHDL
jgi:hypothetical protein